MSRAPTPNNWRELYSDALEDFDPARIEEAQRPSRVRDWFTAWAELGWICAPDLEELIQS